MHCVAEMLGEEVGCDPFPRGGLRIAALENKKAGFLLQRAFASDCGVGAGLNPELEAELIVSIDAELRAELDDDPSDEWLSESESESDSESESGSESVADETSRADCEGTAWWSFGSALERRIGLRAAGPG